MTNLDHQIPQLIRVFDETFSESENTVLIKGSDEPLYLPQSTTGHKNEIHFAHGFFQSALHEIAHWCLAGKHRRTLLDYGYWYEPGPRTPATQKKFQMLEARPQALEKIFSQAVGSDFHLSLDYFGPDRKELEELFAEAVQLHIQDFLNKGLPRRAQIWVEQLSQFTSNWVETSPAMEDRSLRSARLAVPR